MWSGHTMECHSAVNRKEILMPSKAQRNLEYIMSSEKNQHFINLYVDCGTLGSVIYRDRI